MGGLKVYRKSGAKIGGNFLDGEVSGEGRWGGGVKLGFLEDRVLPVKSEWMLLKYGEGVLWILFQEISPPPPHPLQLCRPPRPPPV